MAMTMDRKQGSILILSLWILAFLSILIVQIGLTLRQRINLVGRLEQRSQLHFLAEAGIKKGISAIKQDWQKNDGGMNAQSKYERHNNPERFQNIKMDGGMFDVSYEYPSGSVGKNKFYGWVDEERKININTAERIVLTRLWRIVLDLEEDEAIQLTESIFHWKTPRSLQEKFVLDGYYSTPQRSYVPKRADFELLEELLLVYGMAEDFLERIRPFVTVYGDGMVNINTAPREVLLSLGLDPVVVDKVFNVRRGLDKIEATTDDFIFRQSYDIASEIKSFLQMDLWEVDQIDHLNTTGKLKTSSGFFFIQSQAQLSNSQGKLSARAIYNAKENHVEFWSEK
jgi:general secretion pathway protein K